MVKAVQSSSKWVKKKMLERLQTDSEEAEERAHTAEETEEPLEAENITNESDKSLENSTVWD